MFNFTNVRLIAQGLVNINGEFEPPTIPQVLTRLIPYINALLFGVAPVVLVIMIVMAGVKRLMAADNAKAVEESTGTLFWAVIGYAVVLLSNIIIRLGASLIGFDIVENPGIDLNPK